MFTIALFLQCLGLRSRAADGAFRGSKRYAERQDNKTTIQCGLLPKSIDWSETGKWIELPSCFSCGNSFGDNIDLIGGMMLSLVGLFEFESIPTFCLKTYAAIT